MRSQINVFGDNSEDINYNFPYTPVYIKEGRLSFFENRRAMAHWHEDIEILIITFGQMIYRVNGEDILLKEGDGIIVNSGQLHEEFSRDDSDCGYICFLFNPILLCANEFIESNFVTPVTKSRSFDFILLNEDIDWKKTVTDSTKRVFCSYINDEKSLMLKVQREIFNIWSALYENVTSATTDSAVVGGLYSIKQMMSFIHLHFDEKITLQNIADAGHMCKSSCCYLFKNKMHKSPVEYLTDYRLLKSEELLRDSDNSITEIAYMVGFSGASYFTELFKAHYGISPREFRNKNKILNKVLTY